MLPPEVLQAAKDLRAKRLLPVHSGKFAMANHKWNAPLATISALNQTDSIPLLTPKIGEKVFLNRVEQTFEQWWTVKKV